MANKEWKIPLKERGEKKIRINISLETYCQATGPSGHQPQAYPASAQLIQTTGNAFQTG